MNEENYSVQVKDAFGKYVTINKNLNSKEAKVIENSVNKEKDCFTEVKVIKE